jgi:hydroxypyruvate isomerase
MGWFFTKAALLTFGGAYAVLPYVYQGAVEHYGWLTGTQMIDGLALGETTPGPLIMVVAFVGFVGGWTKAGAGPGRCRFAVRWPRRGDLVHLPAVVHLHPGRRPAGRDHPRQAEIHRAADRDHRRRGRRDRQPGAVLQFAANLSMMYPELPFLERFEAAARDGFKAVEFLFPYEYAASDIKARLDANGLQQVLFNAAPGDWAAGERGLACLPGREAAFRAGLALAFDYAATLACPRLHVVAGLVPEGVTRESVQPTYIANLRWAAGEAARRGVDVLMEPINTRDIPRFFLNRQDHAHAIALEIGADHLKVQMDLYHCQIVEGDLATKIRRYLPSGKVGHIQIAGVPERHEPDVGEINYPYLFALLDELHYDGWIGCEYRPRLGGQVGGTSAGLGWLKAWL